MVFVDPPFLDQIFQQHFAKAARVRHRQPDILIEMKQLDARRSGPVSAGPGCDTEPQAPQGSGGAALSVTSVTVVSVAIREYTIASQAVAQQPPVSA